MLLGVSYALGAGLIWGPVFVTPLLLPAYPGTLLAFGRYLAFGRIALPPGWQARRALRLLSRDDWIVAVSLAAYSSPGAAKDALVTGSPAAEKSGQPHHAPSRTR